MKSKRSALLFLFFVGFITTTAITAQNDSIKTRNSFDIINDSIQTEILPQKINDTKELNNIKKESFSFKVGKSTINKKLWQQTYRFKDKSLKTLSVKIIIKRNTTKKERLDFNLFALIDESKKLRIRPSGVYYPKRDKKKYLKAKPVNENYNDFKETKFKNYQNFEALSYKTNFLGYKKKNILASVKSLKRITIKGKVASYFLDFPVMEGFSYGKIYYKDKPIGFAAVKYQ